MAKKSKKLIVLIVLLFLAGFILGNITGITVAARTEFFTGLGGAKEPGDGDY